MDPARRGPGRNFLVGQSAATSRTSNLGNKAAETGPAAAPSEVGQPAMFH